MIVMFGSGSVDIDSLINSGEVGEYEFCCPKCKKSTLLHDESYPSEPKNNTFSIVESESSGGASGGGGDVSPDEPEVEIPVEKVRKVLRTARDPVSLESPVGSDDDESMVGDFIEDKSAVSPLKATMYSNLKEITNNLLSGLTSREERVLRMRFGIGMESDNTLEDVGKQFSVTRERIRQIEAKALRKLKHPKRAGKLKIFLEEN